MTSRSRASTACPARTSTSATSPAALARAPRSPSSSPRASAAAHRARPCARRAPRRWRPCRASARRRASRCPPRPCAAARARATWLRSATRTERGCPFSSKNTVRVPSSCGFAARDVAHDERLAALDVDADLLPRLHAVEEHRRRQDAHVAVLQPVARVLEPHLRIHEIGREVVVRHRPRQLLLDASRARPRGRPAADARRGARSAASRPSAPSAAAPRESRRRAGPRSPRNSCTTDSGKATSVRGIEHLLFGQARWSPSAAPCHRPPWRSA